MSEWKQTNKTLTILKAAEEGGYGVLATVAYTLDQVVTMIEAAENKRSPLIIQMFPWAVTQYKGELTRAAAEAASRASVPVAIHLDHAQDVELIKQAAHLPFDSIMVDMSHYEKEENLARTKELVAYCHQFHKATEAEPGRIEGSEDGVMDTAELNGILTTPEEAERFIDTGIDILAPAIGNFHGEYPSSGPQLRFDILEKLREPIKERGVRICLHGTNGFDSELLLKNVKHGVSKINVNKLVLDEYLEFFHANASKLPVTVLLEESAKRLLLRMEYWMDACGSSGKA